MNQMLRTRIMLRSARVYRICRIQNICHSFNNCLRIWSQDEPAGQLAFISNGNKGFKPTLGANSPRPPAACFAMAIEGKCTREKCTYSHDRSILQAYLEELKVKIVKSPYHAPVHSTSTPTGSPGKSFQKQSSIAVNDNERHLAEPARHVINLNYSDSSVAEVVQNEFLHSYPEVSRACITYAS